MFIPRLLLRVSAGSTVLIPRLKAERLYTTTYWRGIQGIFSNRNGEVEPLVRGEKGKGKSSFLLKNLFAFFAVAVKILQILIVSRTVGK
jgi:hypothetical protein